MFNNFRNVIGVDLNDVITAFTFGFKDLESFGFITGSDYAVGNFAFDEKSGFNVANVGKSYPVTEGAHSVGAACSCISACERRFVKAFDIVNKAGFFKIIGKRNANCCRSGAYVFEGSYCGHTESFFKFFNKLPAVESIKKVDETGAAVKDLYRKIFAVIHENFGRFLVGVAAVFKFKFFHRSSAPY